MMKLLEEMLGDVQRFNEEICHVSVPAQVLALSPDRATERDNHLREELKEFGDADGWEDQADALVDLIYVALGTLVEMGITPGSVWNEVQRANMAKVHGVKPTRPNNKHDAIKPPGWIGPGLAAAAIPLSTLAALSPVLLDITQLRIERSKQYNRGVVQLEDYFPFGAESYYQMCHVKLLRARSALESSGDPLDSVLDLLNYAVFWAEAMRRGDL